MDLEKRERERFKQRRETEREEGFGSKLYKRFGFDLVM